jgi:hypothetical protein
LLIVRIRSTTAFEKMGRLLRVGSFLSLRSKRTYAAASANEKHHRQESARTAHSGAYACAAEQATGENQSFVDRLAYTGTKARVSNANMSASSAMFRPTRCLPRRSDLQRRGLATKWTEKE